ncbi:Ribosomal protein L21e like protein [Aduncisulcus paluster]|uniref:Ribosomal protein L21e like protein n=1 Tax=Aduncisulcus paluster TaxID=2918883 RepID=A0ABQ5K014_9EUKA|nr:Ribosomal protein L21e like protein [Aduncisulcus paluster]
MTTKSKGLRSGTRRSFARKFGKSGILNTSTYLRPFKIGDYVDITVNSNVHGGMPFKFYKGKTGRVFNVSTRALGVEMNKQVRNRIMKKRIYVRIEHVIPSKCQVEFKKRIAFNEKTHAAAEHVPLKRLPAQPREAHVVKADKVEVVAPVPFEFLL